MCPVGPIGIVVRKEHLMAQAQAGDIVKVHYTGRLTDGTIFDTSRQRDPLEFTLGGGDILPGVEQAVLSMTTGGWCFKRGYRWK
jgi:FKBP-type peptidyl-prolyl cis-trans isomerase